MRLKNEQEWTEVFTERLKKIMKTNYISNVKLAEEVGISENAMINYRTGKSLPNFYVAAKMAKILGISLDRLASLETIDIFEAAGFNEKESAVMRQTCEVCGIEPEKLICIVRQMENLKEKEISELRRGYASERSKKNGIFK